MSKLVKTFIFKDTEAGANAFADGFNRAHPSWKNHRAVVTPHGSGLLAVNGNVNKI